MPLKDGNGNSYKIYKGRAEPVNVYRNAEKIAGYTESTQEGQSISFEGTYEDKFHILQIRGGFTQEGVTEPLDEEISIVYPTFASNYTVNFQGETIEIPKTFTLDDGTEIDAELKAVKNTAGEVSYYDYIEISNGSAKIYKIIKETDVTDWFSKTTASFGFFASKLSTNSFSVYRVIWDTIGLNIQESSGLCSAFTINGFSQVAYNSPKIPYGVCVNAQRIYFSLKCADVGLTNNNTNAEKLEGFKSWVTQLAEAGTPLTIWYASSNPTVIDITNSDVGRALLNLRTHYKNTSISSEAEGAVPSVSATVKVAE